MTNSRQRWRKRPPVPHGDGEEFGVFSDFLTPVLQRSTLGFSQSWFYLSPCKFQWYFIKKLLFHCSQEPDI